MDEILNIILQHKLSFLDTMSNVAMLWWVSSVVFCGYIIAAVWMKRDEIEKKDFPLPWFFFIVFAFFFSIVVFGGWTIFVTTRLYQETNILLEEKSLLLSGVKSDKIFLILTPSPS